METQHLIAGTPEWHAHRATHFNASDAPAMLGCSPYTTRAQLLHKLHTGLAAEHDAATERRFADGHRFEALARPLAEEIIGDDLAPVVGTLGELSASFDGLTMMGDTAFEHKTLNAELAGLPIYGLEGVGIRAADLPKHYRVQMEQQLLVSGAERVLFMASKWEAAGSGASGWQLVEERHCWYASDPVLRAEIIAGWKQFAKDLATYTPSDVKEMPKAEVTLALPALFIHAKGEITTSNMKEYGEALAARLAEVRAIQLISDQDFSNAKESAKLLRENIQQAKLAKDAMLSQTVTVGEAARMIDTWCEDMRLTALKLEQDVDREDKAKKVAMVTAAKDKYVAHITALNVELAPATLGLGVPAFAEAIKNKRNYASMQDALDTMLANAKIAADESARKIRASLACMAEEGKGYEFLLADRLALTGRPVDDLRTLIRARITEHKAAEEKKEAETRERIRAEEQAKAEQQAREKIAAEQRAAAAAELAAAKANPAGADLSPAAQALNEQEGAKRFADAHRSLAPAANVVPMGTRAPAAPSSPPTLKLGDINARLQHLSINEAGLAALGFPATKVKGACLYQESDLPRMVDSIVAHLRMVQASQQKAA